jgi:glyoxylase-like metal-dependent hydrolase (beta-lactamase superfamily II)
MRALLVACASMLAFVTPVAACHAEAPVPLQARYLGTVNLEAHFKRPGETRPFRSQQRFYTDGKDRVRLDWSTGAETDTAWAPESYLVVGDRVYHRDAPDARWQLLAGRKAHEGRLQAYAGFPEGVGREVFSPRAQKRWKRVGKAKHLELFVEPWAHPRLGDVRDSIRYTWSEGDVAPRELRMSLHERDQQWMMTERLLSWSSEATAESLLQAPAAFDPPSTTPETLVDEPKIVSLAPGIWSADMEDIDSRSLIVEFADYLAVIEIAVGSANGERIADAARRIWPQKPIRYAFFSHYHPHYAGGLRAMIAEDATVVTTPGNEAFVRGVAALPFTLEPDRLARTPRPLKVLTFPGRIEIGDSTNQLVAFNYGDRSQHTDEFAVFYLPRARLLFETELGWVRDDNGKLRAIRRAAPLLAWIDEQNLGVDRIVQSWPMHGNAPELSRAMLDSLIQAAKR